MSSPLSLFISRVDPRQPDYLVERYIRSVSKKTDDSGIPEVITEELLRDEERTVFRLKTAFHRLLQKEAAQARVFQNRWFLVKSVKAEKAKKKEDERIKRELREAAARIREHEKNLRERRRRLEEAERAKKMAEFKMEALRCIRQYCYLFDAPMGKLSNRQAQAMEEKLAPLYRLRQDALGLPPPSEGGVSFLGGLPDARPRAVPISNPESLGPSSSSTPQLTSNDSNAHGLLPAPFVDDLPNTTSEVMSSPEPARKTRKRKDYHHADTIIVAQGPAAGEEEMGRGKRRRITRGVNTKIDEHVLDHIL